MGQLRAALAREREETARLRELLRVRDEVHAAELARRDRQVAELTDRVSELERQAGRDSSTSSRPPSSDSPYAKPSRKRRDRSLRQRQGRKPGKQPGAAGSTLRQVPDPDETIECPPSSCRGCGGELSDAPVEGMNTRQVFEPPPPPPRPHVTEYRVQARRCGGCGTVTEGQAPAWAAGRAQYGPRTHAHAANLVSGNHLPVVRAAGLLATMLGGAGACQMVCVQDLSVKISLVLT